MLCAGYAVSRSKRFLLQAALIGFYLLELVLLFGEEWSIQNIATEIGADYYGIRFPVIHATLGAIMGLGEWLVSDTIIGTDSHHASYIASVMTLAGSLAALLIPDPPLHQWAFYTMRQLCFGACLLRVGLHCLKGSAERRALLKRDKRIYLALVALVVATALEDTWSILILPVPTDQTSDLIMTLIYRNIAENATFLLLGWHFSRSSWQLISAHFERPVGHAESASNQNPAALSPQIALLLPAFSQRFNLTEREKEVLLLLLEGNNNRAIAERLFVTEGTIKTHLHNLMKKTGTSTRNELRQLFWSN